MSHSILSPAELADSILRGDAKASAAMGRADIYDALNRGANGSKLPFLGTSTKIEAGTAVGILSAVLYMQPANESGREACTGRSEGCTAACLAEETGKMSFPNARRARRRRHASFYADRNRFLADVHVEIAGVERSAIKQGKVAAIRLNGTTGMPWHRMAYTAHDGTRYARIHDAFPNVHFYEYTKAPLRMESRGGIPANLSLTFSISERADADAEAARYLDAGYGAAVVTFTKRHQPPARFTVDGASYPTVDGDAHDARFLDPAGHVVILAAKGRAKTDESGFVRVVA